jgi:RimJ/RimL family protein N-acetyltransferase
MIEERIEPIVTAVCKEKKGDVIRSVRPMPYTIENFSEFWDKARQFKNIFSKEITDNFGAFIENFIHFDPRTNMVTSDCLLWVIDDFVGVYYLTNMYKNEDALVHYTFFDRTHHGRYDLTIKMLNYVFQTYGYHRLSVEIPLYASDYSFKFIESLGFKPEGRKRKSIQHNGDWFDVKLFGIFPEDVGIPFVREKENSSREISHNG